MREFNLIGRQKSTKYTMEKIFWQTAFLKLFSALVILGLTTSSLKAQQDKGNEYRITLFPSARITDKITGFAYLGYVWNTEKNSRPIT